MKEEKTLEIDGKKYVVYELTVKQIRLLGPKIQKLAGESGGVDVAKLQDFAVDLLPRIVRLQTPSGLVGIVPDDLDEFTPSQLEKLWQSFQEANAVFLRILSQTGIVKPISEAWKSLEMSFQQNVEAAVGTTTDES